MAGDDNADEIARKAKTLPPAERFTHANWRVRSDAYADAASAAASGADAELVTEFGHLAVKAIGDSNAAAQERALEALLAVLMQPAGAEDFVARNGGALSAALVSKALGARPSAAAKASETFLALIAADGAPDVTAALVAGFEHKQPKVVAACVEALYVALAAFGSTVIPPKAIVKPLARLFDAKDGGVRDGAKRLAAELAKWVGPETVRSLLMGDKMRDAAKADLDKLLADVTGGKPQAGRYTRKEAARRLAAGVTMADTAEGGDPRPSATPAAASAPPPAGVGVASDEAYELCEPYDLLGALDKSKTFWAGVAAPSWKDRLAALQELRAAASGSPRLGAGDYGEVGRTLKKLLADANVALCAEAAQCVTALAVGARAEWGGPARALWAPLLDKGKDKNVVLARAVAAAQLSLLAHKCVTLGDVADDLATGMAHKVPKVRADALRLLGRAAVRGAALDPPLAVPPPPKGDAAKLLRDLTATAAKLCDDGDADVRDAAATAVAVLALAAGGLAAVTKATTGLDDAKKAKVALEYARLTGPSTVAAAQVVAAAKSPSRPSAAVPPPSKRPSTAPAGGRKAASTKATAASSAMAEEDESGGVSSLSPEEIESRAAAIPGITASMLASLRAPEWKSRLAASTSFVAAVLAAGTSGTLGGRDGAEVALRCLAASPGWGDANAQVVCTLMDCVAGLAGVTPAGLLSRRAASITLEPLAARLHDLKLKRPAGDALTSLAESLGPAWVSASLWKKVKEHKNPRVTAEALAWVAAAVDDFTLSGGGYKLGDVVTMAKDALASTSAPLRAAAAKLLGAAQRTAGAAVRSALGDVKPAVLAAVDVELAVTKWAHDPSAAPARSVRQPVVAAAVVVASGGSVPGGRTVAVVGGSHPAQGGSAFEMPREDISAKITAKVIKDLGSSNWKERQAAIASIAPLLASAGGRILPALGPELLPALKSRLADTNRNLAIEALDALGAIAAAVGPPAERLARSALPDMCRQLGDSKKLVRDAALRCLDSHAGASGPGSVLPVVAAVSLEPKLGSDGRTEALHWVSSHVARAVGTPGTWMVDALKAACAGQGDKDAGVRAAAAKALESLGAAVAPPEMAKALKGMTPAAAALAVPMIERGAATTAAAAVTQPGGSLPSVTAPTPAMATPAAAGGALTPAPLSPTRRLSGRTVASPAHTTRTSLGGVTAPRPSTAGASTGGAASDSGPLVVVAPAKEREARAVRERPRIGGGGSGPSLGASPTAEALDELDTAMAGIVRGDIRSGLFSPDFRKQVAAWDALLRDLPSLLPAVCSSLDLFLRLLGHRLGESNTAVLLKALEASDVLLAALATAGVRLTDADASGFLPSLVDKWGHNSEAVRDKFGAAVRRVTAVYPVSRLVPHLIDGLKSKNGRTRVECADELGALVERHGLESAERGAKLLPALAAAADERDASLRTAALGALCAAYKVAGDGVWLVLNKGNGLQAPVKALIEDKFKWKAKEMAKLGEGRPGAARGVVLRAPVAAAVATAAAAPASSAAVVAAPLVSAPVAVPLTANPRPLPPPASSVTEDGPGYVDGSPAAASRAMMAAVTAMADSPAYLALGPTGAASAAAASWSPAPPPAAFSLDAQIAADWASALAAITTAAPGPAVEAMKLVCHELMEAAGGHHTAATCAGFASDADALVAALAARVAPTFAAAASGDGSRGCKYVLNALMQVFSLPAMAVAVSEPSLRSAVGALLARLLDDDLAAAAEGDQLLKALNVLMLKLLDAADRTSSFCALVGLLREPPGAGTPSGARFGDLVVKCLIKLTRALAAPGGVSGVRVDSVLLAVHRFFASLGLEEVRRLGATDDKPLRMVKTLLNELCKALGPSLASHCTLLPPRGDPCAIIYALMDVNLRALGPGPGPASLAAAASAPLAPSHVGVAVASAGVGLGITSTTATASAAAAAAAAGGDVKGALAAIFRRIGDKSTTGAALADLAAFVKHHPAVDLAPHLARTSAAFQDYIRAGLAAADAANAAAPAAESAAAATKPAAGAENKEPNWAVGTKGGVPVVGPATAEAPRGPAPLLVQGESAPPPMAAASALAIAASAAAGASNKSAGAMTLTALQQRMERLKTAR